jgi:hypothetical protein
MAITFNWSVQKMQVANNKLVIKVDLLVTGTDGEVTAAAAYSRDLTYGGSFTPYEELTEQQVLDWCFAPEIITLDDQTSITRLIKDEGEAQVAGQIARQLAQKESEPALPWAQIPA